MEIKCLRQNENGRCCMYTTADFELTLSCLGYSDCEWFACVDEVVDYIVAKDGE